MTPEEKRKTFQRLKALSNESFWRSMNVLHNGAYMAAMRHYGEAMDIILTPKQKAAVEAKAAEIRELWDGMATISIDQTDLRSFYGVREEERAHDRTGSN